MSDPQAELTRIRDSLESLRGQASGTTAMAFMWNGEAYVASFLDNRNDAVIASRLCALTQALAFWYDVNQPLLGVSEECLYEFLQSDRYRLGTRHPNEVTTFGRAIEVLQLAADDFLGMLIAARTRESGEHLPITGVARISTNRRTQWSFLYDAYDQQRSSGVSDDEARTAAVAAYRERYPGVNRSVVQAALRKRISTVRRQSPNSLSSQGPLHSPSSPPRRSDGRCVC